MTFRTTGQNATCIRPAFTLPELLVVVTVTLILMSILVQASTIITTTVSEAKAQGDFVGQERMAIAVMRRDLQCDHFIEEDSNSGPSKGRRLSDQRSDVALMSADNRSIIGYKPPRSGYFWAKAPGADSIDNFDEGYDGQFFSSRSGNHFMQFTVILPGGAPSDTLTANIPSQPPPIRPITSTCAEVAYFLVLNGKTPSGINYYKLIRRQRIAARNTDDAPAYVQLLNSSGAPKDDPPEVAAVTGNSGNFNVLNLNDLSFLANRFGVIIAQKPIGGDPAIPTAYRTGEDVLHNHVLSFQLMFKGTAAAGVTWPRPFGLTNTYFPYDTLPFDGEYDTGDESLVRTVSTGTNRNLAGSSQGTNSSRLKPIRLTGVQITLRCWNPINRQTRQTTTAVDL
ncbi:type II secretion system protein [Gemmata sp. JC717]|uniref:prepilin-type N-terminal cleavage/methylation domain-containing protein n=1 Tax=Gemmata algarum TaxID=2975278 RepID=UPI0021BA53CA|nr:type II secretion system protein [Gemmata algarum]MDY3552347.1 type II secretion system protein [Gemmata algarum]